MIASTILIFLICYALAFAHNSLSLRVLHVADIVSLCAAVTLFSGIVYIFLRVHRTVHSLDRAIGTTITNNPSTSASPSAEPLEPAMATHNLRQLELVHMAESISLHKTAELVRAQKEVRRGKYFVLSLLSFLALFTARCLYVLYTTLQAALITHALRCTPCLSNGR